MTRLLAAYFFGMGLLSQLAAEEDVDVRVTVKVVGKPVEKEREWREFIDRMSVYLVERVAEYPPMVSPEGHVKAVEVEDGFLKDERFKDVKDGVYTLGVKPSGPVGGGGNFCRKVVVKGGKSSVREVYVTLPLNMVDFQFQVGGELTFKERDELRFMVEIYQMDAKDDAERVVDLKVEEGRRFFEDRTMRKVVLFMIPDGVYSARVTSTRVKSGNVDRVSKVVSFEIKDGKVVGGVVKFDEVAG